MARLVLTRRDGEKIIIRTPAGPARRIVVTVRTKRNQVGRSVAVEADDGVEINREEIDVKKFPQNGVMTPRSKRES